MMVLISSVNVLRFFSPIRIIEFIALLSLLPIFKIEWQSAVLIFNAFFPIIAGSIIYEAILDKEGFRKGLKKSGLNYQVGIGMQFIGIAVFAMSSFNVDSEKIPDIVYYSLITILIGGGLEAFHKITTKKLSNVKLSPVQEVLTIIGFTLILLYFALHVYFTILPNVNWG